MEWLVCKACGSNAIMPMHVSIDGRDLQDLDDLEIDGFDLSEDEIDEFEEPTNEDSLSPEEDQESRFFTCHVCGDNWLSVREDAEDATCHITFIHQMGMAPVLKRVARMETHIVVNENTVQNWEYYLDDEQVDEQVWLEKLSGRRKVLKSVCTN